MSSFWDHLKPQKCAGSFFCLRPVTLRRLRLLNLDIKHSCCVSITTFSDVCGLLILMPDVNQRYIVVLMEGGGVMHNLFVAHPLTGRLSNNMTLCAVRTLRPHLNSL